MPRQLKRIPRADTHPELPVNPDVVQPGVYKWPPHFQPILIFYVFVGGIVGTYARFLFAQTLPSVDGWPIATLLVNLTGAFGLGLLVETLSRLGRDQGILRAARLLIGTGVIGGFTTYSTFALEVNTLISASNTVTALSYIAVTISGGLILCSLGIQLATHYHKDKDRRS